MSIKSVSVSHSIYTSTVHLLDVIIIIIIITIKTFINESTY